MPQRRVPDLLTVGKIARSLDAPIHRVIYVLRTRPEIRPRARAGGIRLFDRRALDAIHRELASISEGRTLGGVTHE